MKFSMEMRVFAAVFLCFAVLAIYQAKFAPPPPKPEPAASPAASATPGTTPTGVAQAPASTPAPAPAAPEAKPLVADSASRDIVVETDAYIATFDTRGGVLKSFRLRHYPDATGHPLELIP